MICCCFAQANPNTSRRYKMGSKHERPKILGWLFRRGGSLHLMGVWSQKKTGANNIHLLYAEKLLLSVRELKVDRSCAKADPVDIKVGNINVRWGWGDCKERFVMNMGITTGVDGVHWKYIIWEIKTQGWVEACDAKTEEEWFIYSIILHGPG